MALVPGLVSLRQIVIGLGLMIGQQEKDRAGGNGTGKQRGDETGRKDDRGDQDFFPQGEARAQDRCHGDRGGCRGSPPNP
jgi:hypothetical protein